MLARLLCFTLLFSASVFAADSQSNRSSNKPAPVETFDIGSGADYPLQPSDLLKIEVFQEVELMREVRISQEYSITLPLIGKIDLRGKTLRQAEELIRQLYDKNYLVNPQVTLAVKEYAKRTVDVQGQVGKPGAVEFPMEKGLTLLGAITRAEGFTRLADKKRVLLTRQKEDGSKETIVVNADEIIEGQSKETWPLQPGDSIFVKERIL